MVGWDAVSPTTHLQVSHPVFHQCQMMFHHLPSAAAPQELLSPAALPAWVAAAGAAGSTSPTPQNRTSSHTSAWAVCLISRNTPSRDARQSKHNNNSKVKCRKQLVNLWIRDIVTAKSMDTALPDTIGKLLFP